MTTSTTRAVWSIALSLLIIGVVACASPFSQQTSSHTLSSTSTTSSHTLSSTPTTSSTVVTPLSSEYDRWSASNAVMFGYDAGHSHYNPFEKTLNASNVAKLGSGGVVYFGVSNADHHLYALDAATGRQKWAFQTSDVINSSPAVANGVVYIGCGDHLYSIDVATGRQKWTFAARGSIVSTPVVANGVVYFGYATDGRLGEGPQALDAATGQLLWEDNDNSTPVLLASPIVADGTLYFSSNDDTLHVYSL